MVNAASAVPVEFADHPNVQLIRREENGGAAAARNTGVAAVDGDLIASLDSDDAWLPNKLANQIALFERLSQTHNPDLLVVGSGFYDPNRTTGSLRAHADERVRTGLVCQRMLVCPWLKHPYESQSVRNCWAAG